MTLTPVTNGRNCCTYPNSGGHELPFTCRLCKCFKVVVCTETAVYSDIWGFVCGRLMHWDTNWRGKNKCHLC